MPNYWIVICPEKRAPGRLWGNWRKENCVAVGWWPPKKYSIENPRKKKEKGKGNGWEKARACLRVMEPGDLVIPYLCNFRMGIPGRITALRLNHWRRTLTTPGKPRGELGRRIEIEWLKAGMPPSEKIVRIPKTARHGPVTRPTLRSLKPERYEELLGYIRNPENWIDYP